MKAPPIALLTRRLAETPPDFLPGSDSPDIRAVVFDVLRDLGHPAPRPQDLSWLRGGEAPENKPGAGQRASELALVCAWLLADPGLVAAGAVDHRLGQRAVAWLAADLAELAAVAAAEAFVRDEDRREELARLCLAGLDLLPEGETADQMEDRLSAVSSVARARVVAAAREKLQAARLEAQREAERARKVQEELQRKAEAEAAAKGSRE